MLDDRIPIVAPPAYVVLVQAALGARYHVASNAPHVSALDSFRDPVGSQDGILWSCGHHHLTRQEAAECVRRQAGAFC